MRDACQANASMPIDFVFSSARGGATVKTGTAGVAMDGVTEARSGKPPEVQGLLNHFVYHPAARRLAIWLAATPATPNMVSVTGAAMVIAAGAFYALVDGAAGITIGFALHLGWHVVDGADGDLARMIGRASPAGEIVDGLCDYGGHLVLYALLAFSLQATLGGWAWTLALAAGLSRIAQSVYAESQRRTYMWWVYGIPWLRTTGRGSVARAGGGLAGIYIAVSNFLSAGTAPVDRLVAAAQADPGERQRVAELVREIGRYTLPAQLVLGSNPRTILLGLSMAAGSPAWFFLIELTLLNIVMVGSILQQRRACRRLADLIARGRS